MDILRAPRGWSPQTALAADFPAIGRLCRAALPEIRALERRLDHDEAAGRDTACLRQAIGELLWRLQYTGDAAAAAKTLDRVRTLGSSPPPATSAARDREGSFGVGTDVWFLKLDASIDAMLADDFDAVGVQPRFLDRVNGPERLISYLDNLRVSHLAEDGVDHRKELNFATADLVRLILRRRPSGYPWDPRLDTAIRRFVDDWQDPTTGFFGADYNIAGQRWRTADLSLTFHMARYLEGKIGYWPRLIDTLIEIRDERYPNGWLDDEGLTSHNNYDVGVLFSLGWPHMRPDQRLRAREELGRLLGWCLDAAIAADGTVVARAVGESLPESYYFTAAFLDTVGLFNRAKRFWTDREFPQAPGLRARLEIRILELHQGDPMVSMALDRLRR
ncbi:MAG TPA: hypothetical protein VMS01_09200 [Stellaceae bacterium]|nr:hypothetical protein [Stellaceae bacterium]